MADNITTNDFVGNHDLNQSLLINNYVHKNIRVPLETLFYQQNQLIGDEKPETILNVDKMNLKTKPLSIQNIWSIKVEPIMNQIMMLSESTKQKTIGFIGEAGSGKSSLINSILGDELLPTDYEETCTASIAAISSWKEDYYQVFIYFISEEKWKLESDNAIETKNVFKNDTENELPDDLKAFMFKQKCLFNSKTIDEASLDSLPGDVKEKISKGYELFENKKLETLKSHLNDFAAKNGRWWPIVDKIYIRGPFKKLNSDIMLFDIPGYGDGYEAMTIRAAEAAAACDQLVHVVGGNGRSSLEPNFLKGLLRSSASLKHLSLVITHRNIFVEQRKKQKDNNNGSIEEQYKGKLKNKANEVLLEPFSGEYVEKFIDNLPVYYVENKCARNDWSENEEKFLDVFISEELNNFICQELDKNRFDIINNINVLLKLLSVELSHPLCEVIRDDELNPLTEKCLNAFSTEIERLKLRLGNGCKKLWDENFWPVLKKTSRNINPNRYDNENCQTLRKNLTGYDYTRISNELSSDVIDESKIGTLPTAEGALTDILHFNDLEVIFNENLFFPLKVILKSKKAELLCPTVDQYTVKVQYFVKRFKDSIELALQCIRQQVKHSMNKEMRDVIKKRLWLGDKLNHVSGRGTKEKYLTSLRNFITELDNTDSNFAEKLYQRLSPYFENIFNALTNLNDDIKATIDDLDFVYKLDEELKEKVLKHLFLLPSNFIRADDDDVDQLPHQAIATIQSNVLLEVVETQVTKEYWTLSNIHKFNDEILAPIPAAYRDISFTYLYYGYVYVLSNKAMPKLYKIGYTTLLPTQRAQKLYTTGVPLHFVVKKSYFCCNCKLFEQWMHKLFKKHRLTTSREFFRVPLQIIIDVGDKLETIMKEKYRTK